MKRLNIGPGGGWQRTGWHTLDYYNTEADILLDLRELTRIPVPSSSLRIVYSSHTIEHTSDAACRQLLKEAHRILAPGGLLRLACPDFDRAISNYRELGDPDPKNRVVPKAMRRAEQHLRLLSIFASFRKSGGFSGVQNNGENYAGGPIASKEEVERALETKSLAEFSRWCVGMIPADADYVAHVNCYDFDKLRTMLKEAGFMDIRRSGYRESLRKELRQEGFDNRPELSLYVEARAGGWKKEVTKLARAVQRSYRQKSVQPLQRVGRGYLKYWVKATRKFA